MAAVQIGDVIAILKEIYNAYDAWRSIPKKLRQVLENFKDTEEEVRTLNKVLASSRRPEHRSYPGTDKLIADLKEARNYFERYEPLTDENGKVRMTTRVAKTVTARWNWEAVNAYVENVNSHREKMKDFKEIVLIQAALDNTELLLSSIKLQFSSGQAHFHGPVDHQLAPDNSSTISSDRMSILTKASKSLKYARRLESNSVSQPKLTLSPVVEASSASTESAGMNADLKQEIADYVERTELYRPEALQTDRLQDLEYIGRLPGRWKKSQQRTREQAQYQPSSSGGVREQAQYQPSSSGGTPDFPSSISIQSLDHHVNGSLRPAAGPRNAIDDDVSISPSWKRVFGSVQLEGNERNSILSDVRSLPGPALDLDNFSDSDSSIVDVTDPIDNHFTLPEPIMVITPWTGSKPIQCHLKMVQSEGSLCIRSTSVRTFHVDAMPTLGGGVGISPSSLLRIKKETAGAIRSSDSMSLVFNHAVLGGLDSFPRILHPTTESTATPTNTHPYAVEFYGHQFLNVEGYHELPKAVRGLAYLFRNKNDRDLVREKIFGKKLLASVGISTIQFDKKDQMKPCRTQAMSLWLSTQSDTATLSDRLPASDLLTVTVQCNSRGKPTEPDCAIEMAVLKARNIESVRSKEGKELELEVLPLLNKTDEDEATMAGAVLSSNASAVSTSSDRSQSVASTSPETKKSSIFFKRRTSSVVSVTTLKPSSPFRCYIKFTESSDNYILAKKRFVDALKVNLPKG
ncbi:hypothetical protein H2198_009431 [Neophaeococcomyces mojaviensis]|uniref:Uncharacterized protein n=1 Tax=Neophaeococcomyces mojaviensis TaxID=3383035 RepID=A0ACC2ZUM3_9EURO|nr:hypothetical protein H2198_009431 [Knufia sp. JES_112]